MTKPLDLILSRDMPGKTANEYLQRSRPHLLNQQEQFLDYKDGARYPVEDATIRSEIAAMMEGAKRIPRAVGAGKSAAKLKPVPFNPKSADISDVYRLVIDKTHKAADAFTPPCWLDGRSGPDPKNIICVENGLLDIATRELSDHTPAFFTRNRIPCKYDEAAPESARWLTFLAEITDARPQLVTLLQEMIGYKLSPDVSQQRIFLYAGLQGAGKGTLMTVERLLIGERNITNSNIKTLSGQFGAAGLVGKNNLYVTDMNVSNGKALSDAANLLNAISGGDGITVERKFKDDYNCVLPLHITLAGNRLPNLGSHTEAMLRRLLVVPFDVTFQDNADRDLAKKLAEDLSAILNWALVGLDRVQLHGDFSEPQESKNAKARLRHIGDDTQIFLAERCTIERDAVTDKDVFYDLEYIEWCAEARVTPLPKNTFAERLREINPNIYPSKQRRGDKQVPVYRGIRLSDEWLGKRYRLDENLIAMGYPAAEAVLCNSRGEPIRLGAQNDFD